MNILKKLCLITMVLYGLVFAQPQAPNIFLENITQSVIQQIENIPAEEQKEAIDEIIDRTIMPYVDMDFIAKWVVGRPIWQKTTPALQQQFTHELSKLLSKTYSSTLLAFKDRKIQYLPVRNLDLSKKTIQVICLLQAMPNSNDHIEVIYQLRLSNDKWLIFDIVVQGVSMIKGLHSQFSDDLSRYGVAQVLEYMKQPDYLSKKSQKKNKI